jgi:hypothetical protein
MSDNEYVDNGIESDNSINSNNIAMKNNATGCSKIITKKSFNGEDNHVDMVKEEDTSNIVERCPKQRFGRVRY